MDIDLLARMVKEVMLDHDAVTLPGLGSFAAEFVPASFTDKGYTINPPYRRLYFIPREGTDTLLATLYSRSNNISVPDSTALLREFLLGLKEVLLAKRIVVFPGLGRLRATRENHLFFVADETLDIYPAALGLEPISLKTHEETPEQLADAVTSLAQILEPSPAAPAEEPTPEVPSEEPVPEAAAEEPAPAIGPAPAEEPTPEVPSEEPVPATPAATSETPAEEPVPDTPDLTPEAPAEAPAPETGRHRAFPWKGILTALGIMAGIVLLLAAALAIVGRLAPEWIDYYLYSPEQLEILHNL